MLADVIKQGPFVFLRVLFSDEDIFLFTIGSVPLGTSITSITGIAIYVHEFFSNGFLDRINFGLNLFVPSL